MKKGTAVKFIGTDKKSAIEKTYIWDVVETKDATLYLIQHPEGTLFTPETKKDFEGFNTTKLTHGKSYMVAYANELIDLTEPIINNESSNNQLITVTLPREYFEEIKNYLSVQKEQMETNKMVRMTMKKEELAEAIHYFSEMIKTTENALSQPQNSLEPSPEVANTTVNEDILETTEPTINNQQPTTNV